MKLPSLGLSSLRIASLLCGLGIASPAYAQSGEGVESGAYALDLGVDLLFGVNTNLFYESQDAPTRRDPVPVLRVRPEIGLTTMDPQELDLTLRWSLGWNQFLGERAERGQSGLSTTLAASAHLFPKRALSLKLEEAFTRTNDPTNKPGDESFNRNVNRLGAVLGVHPGGRAIQGFLSYHWGWFNNDFLSDGRLASLNKSDHDLKLRALYKFLPKTVALVDVDFSIISYDSEFRTVAGGNQPSPLRNVDSMPLRLKAGINGLITNGISVRLLGGYGWGFYELGADPNTFLVDAELKYHFGVLRDNSVGIGFERDWRDSMIGNFFTYNRPYVSFSSAFADKRLTFDASLSVDFRHYELTLDNAVVNSNTASFAIPNTINDTVYRANAGLSYQFTPWLVAGIDYTLLANTTDDNVDLINAVPGVTELQGRSFLQNVIMGRVGVRY